MRVVLQVLLDENFMEYTGGQPLPMQDFGKVTRAMQLVDGTYPIKYNPDTILVLFRRPRRRAVHYNQVKTEHKKYLFEYCFFNSQCGVV